MKNFTEVRWTDYKEVVHAHLWKSVPTANRSRLTIKPLNWLNFKFVRGKGPKCRSMRSSTSTVDFLLLSRSKRFRKHSPTQTMTLKRSVRDYAIWAVQLVLVILNITSAR